jgi:SAM-dependent methyltransferase
VTCPLCGDPTPQRLAAIHDRLYHRCGQCGLAFLDRSMLLGSSEERARYETHENDPADARYRAFLDRLAAPLVERLPVGAEGLDYGSGPGPTLSVMLEERGFPMAVYDPFFAPDPSVLERTYDFITCTETAEHFFEPATEFDRLERLLRPGGWLGLMTGVLHSDIGFEKWWYVRDPTHVCFYAPETFRWIAGHYGWSLVAPARNVVLFRRPHRL